MRPYETLPLPAPAGYDPGPEWFYRNIVKALVPDMIQIMNTGLNIDQAAVEELRKTIDEVQKTVYERLENNDIVKRYQIQRLPQAQREYAEKCTQATRSKDYYLQEYSPGNMLHRTWIINTYLKHIGRGDDVKEKWAVKDLKDYNIFLQDPFVTAIIDKRPITSNPHVLEGMEKLAEYKTELWNRPREEKAKIPVTLDPFNPNSDKQIREIFQMLEIPPMAFSKKTGDASWGREPLETLRKQTEDPIMIEFLDALIDNSYSAIIKNNFIKAFDTFTIDGILHGNIVLFGAKSFRPTSNNPNLLNAPSTKSIYAKPLKRCFIAPDGRIIYTADLQALEDRVLANLTKDKNKCNIFLEGLDGHSLNACGYFIEEVKKVLGDLPDQVELVKAFMREVDSGNKQLSTLRQKSKAPTFKLAYGGFPDADKGGVITQEIFDNYHQVLYPGVTDYRENYVLRTTQQFGYIHLGLGCRLYSSDPYSHIRTLHNGTIQFWSILTLIAINELKYRIREEHLEGEISVQSTIYDSIYTSVVKDPEVIQWLNNNMIEVMCVQYLEDEIIPNAAQGEIGNNWADLHKLSNNADIDEIKEVLSML